MASTHSNHPRRSRVVNSGQFLLFAHETFVARATARQPVVVASPAPEFVIQKPAQQMESERRTIQDMRQEIKSMARDHLWRLVGDLQHTVLKPDYYAEWTALDSSGKWSWPTEEMHQRLALRVQRQMEQTHTYPNPHRQARQRQTLRWAGYNRYVVEQLGTLDLLLRTGQTQRFVAACKSEGGFFSKKIQDKNDDTRLHKKLRPRWPLGTEEFKVLEKESS